MSDSLVLESALTMQPADVRVTPVLTAAPPYPQAMRRLVHHPLCPFSRTVRLVLAEKDIAFTLIEENFYEKRPQLLRLNPSGRLPICIEEDTQAILVESLPIVEYFEELGVGRPLLPTDLYERAEVRRLCRLFDDSFYREAVEPLLNERVWKRLTRDGYPDSRVIRASLEAVRHHLRQISLLAENGDCLVGERLSLADLTAAAHLSVLDFIGDIPWNDEKEQQNFAIARLWYARIKSRKSFRTLVGDSVRGVTPPEHYADPDF